MFAIKEDRKCKSRMRQDAAVLAIMMILCHAKVAELADALDLGSSGATRAGSSPAFRTRSFLRRGGEG